MTVTPSLILFWMLRLAPSEPHAQTFQETAEAIAKAANSDRDPLDAAATLTAIAFYESHFDPSAVSRTDDPTRSYGVFQLSTQWVKPPVPIYTQASIALFLARDSLKRCGSLAMYASGSCGNGKEAAKDREKLAAKIKHPAILEARLPKRYKVHMI